MENFEPIDIEFIINNPEVKASTEQIKTDLKSVGQTAEETAAKVTNQLKGAFARTDNANAINQINAGLKEQATIINGTKPAYNGLGNSINQISREMSAFSVSAQTGFLAVSNNIPILADEIKRLKDRNIELAASGQKIIPVWKQVVSGLFSWQTALSVGITLLTVYGAKIIDWISNLNEGAKASKALAASQEAVNTALNNFYGNQVTKLNTYVGILEDVNTNEQDRLNITQALIKEVPNLTNADFEYGNNLDVVKQKIGQYVLAQASRIEADTLVKENTELLSKKALLEAKLSGDIVKTTEKNSFKTIEVNKKAAAELRRYLKEIGFVTTEFNSGVLTEISDFKLVEKARKELASFEKELKPIEDRLSELYGISFGNDKANDTTKGTVKYYKELISNNEKLIEQKKTLNDLDSVRALQEENKKYQSKIDIILNKKPDERKVVSSYQNLLDKLSELDKEYSRKSFTKDEEELQALRDKFDKIRQLVERFNADPKNKAQIIDLSNLDQLQVKAEASLTYRQTTDKLKEELDAQKQLFKEYEDYKQKLGQAEADKRYADELKGFDSYLAALQDKIKNNDVAFKAVELGTADGPQTERVALLQNALKNEQLTTEAHFKELLAKYQTFEERRKVATEQYQEAYNSLVASGEKEKADQLTRLWKDELDKIAQEEIASTDAYKRLISGVENLSINAAQTVIAEIRRMVETLVTAKKITEIAADDIISKLDEAQKKIQDQNDEDPTSEWLKKRSNEMGQLSSAFLELGASLESYDEGLASTITTVGELLEVTSNVAKAGASFASGDIIGGISASISAISGILRIGAAARESEKKAQEELLRLQQEREDGERTLNKLQRERNLDKAKEIELTLEALKAQRLALELNKQQAQQDEQSLLRELQGGQYITGSTTEKYGGFLGIGRQTRVVNTYGSLLGKTFEEIESFYERGLLEGRVEKLFEQIRALKEEGANIDDLLQQLEDDTRAALTGTTETAISDSIVNGLKQGYRSFEDFASDIESLLQDAILNSIKFNTLEEPIKKLYEEFANYAESEGELSTAEADVLRSKYQELVQNAINQYNQLSGVINDDLINTEQASGLSGQIRRELTEETGGELLGLFRGQYDVTRRLLEATEIYYEKENRHQANLIDLISINTKIETNTANTVLELQTAVVELKKIADNTEKIYINDIG